MDCSCQIWMTLQVLVPQHNIYKQPRPFSGNKIAYLFCIILNQWLKYRIYIHTRSFPSIITVHYRGQWLVPQPTELLVQGPLNPCLPVCIRLYALLGNLIQLIPSFQMLLPPCSPPLEGLLDSSHFFLQQIYLFPPSQMSCACLRPLDPDR